ncbi:MAG: 4-(cytidine 5'-diphospho)-2-C-methyl-D-erythritol kinase [Calditrichota bacterium]
MNTPRLTLTAPAKINLGLRVLDRRPDGYHNLITIMQRVSLHDIVTVEYIPEGIEYQGPVLTDNPEANLCLKAARAFYQEYQTPGGARIHLVKNIPVGAGLGGGSSDAAAVLLGLAQIHNIDAGRPSFREIASRLGSDVPFFVKSVSAALVQERGELMESITSLNLEKWLTIVWPGFSIYTDWAYQRLDETLTLPIIDDKLLVRSFSRYRGGVPTPEMRNDFEIPVFGAYPQLIQARDGLIEAGAKYAGLTGSGSGLYGLFDGEAEAKAAASDFAPSWLSFVCRPC